MQVTRPQKISLDGEIVETLEKEGTRFAKIYLHPACINVLIEMNDQVHLGDHVLIDINSMSIQLGPADNDAQRDQLFQTGLNE
jgi:hypothetical protein